MSSQDSLRWNDDALIPVIAQDAETGEVRMMAWADHRALELTLETGEAHFFSRSRQAMWKKGETSGNTLAVREVWTDCDGDTLLYMVEPAGPSCHTGAETCFFRRVTDAGRPSEAEEGSFATPTLGRLEQTLFDRASSTASKSYTKSLLDGGPEKIAAKVQEEAIEFGDAIREETDDRVASEAGDVLYHLMVGLISRRVPVRAVLAVLSKRFGRSGHDEKASRTPPPK